MARNFGESDPVRDVQHVSLRVLATELRRLRKVQLREQRKNIDPNPEFVEMAGNLIRSTATLTAELRKSGKDVRDAGSKVTPAEREQMVVAYLREQRPEKREALLAEARAEAADA